MPISVFDLFQPHNLHRAVMGTRSERAASPDRCTTRANASKRQQAEKVGLVPAGIKLFAFEAALLGPIALE